MKNYKSSSKTFALTFSIALALALTSSRGPMILVHSAKNITATVTDIGPEFGISYSGEGFAINHNDPRQILLPSEGGIFKSLNGGLSWFPVNLVTEDQGFTDGAILVRQDPGNPSVLLAVTLRFSNSESGQWVYRSKDFGTTWNRLEGNFPSPTDCAIHQTSSDLVFVLNNTAHDAALWRSTDGGLTFEPQFDNGLPQAIFDPDTDELLADPRFSNIATTPTDPSVVYVVLNSDPKKYYRPAIYKSADSGATFTRLEGSPPGDLQVFPHPTQSNVLFVQDDSDLESPGIYRSTDSGISFQPVNTGLPSGKWNFFVAFDPLNPSFVYVAGEGGFFRSVNGGNTFQLLGLKPEQLGLGASTATVDPSNPNTVYVNTNRGNFKSVNGGISFVAINNGWKDAFANHITFDNAIEPNLYLTVPIGVGILKTHTRGNDYAQVPHPLDPGELHSGAAWPSTLAVSHGDPNFIVTATRNRGLFRTIDGGQNWTAATIDTGQNRFSSLVSEIAIDPLHSNNVYVVTGNTGFPGFYRSTDGGSTFQRTYFVPTSNARSAFTDLALDPSNPNVLYTGSAAFLTSNVLLKSTDAGLSFSGTQLGFASRIIDIAVDPTNSNNVYVAGTYRLSSQGFSLNRLLRSTNAGATFVAADAGLEGEIIAIVIDPQNPSRLYAWTKEGLFMSGDGALTWSPLENEKTRQAAGFGTAIAINPKKPNRLYLAGATVLEVEINE
jgi:photosystem II stability/assembly factor-like uncharacterized protein